VRALTPVSWERFHDLPHQTEQLAVTVYLPGTVPLCASVLAENSTDPSFRDLLVPQGPPAAVRLLADAQPSADVGHVHALPKINVSLPKQAYDLLCTASLLHERTLSSPTRGTRILSQDRGQDLGRGSPAIPTLIPTPSTHAMAHQALSPEMQTAASPGIPEDTAVSVPPRGV
jgi:hypothetical protein